MAAANGTLSPPSLPQAPNSPAAAKRKLAERPAIAVNGASTPAPGESASASARSLQAVLGDILAVLKRYAACEEFPASRVIAVMPAAHARNALAGLVRTSESHVDTE